VASLHAQQSGLEISYMPETAETHRARDIRYDLVLALEIVEHVADVPHFLQTLHGLVKPGGVLVMSTINRTLQSLLTAKIGAEYVLRWLPRGTHNWQQFLRPSELILPLESLGMHQQDVRGMRYHMLQQRWALDTTNTSVNYLLTMRQPKP
jgi:2-polyprenyl-6-hydroxyphenyl methylase/3-demethylubiquinone-9 3-methyltransferase